MDESDVIKSYAMKMDAELEKQLLYQIEVMNDKINAQIKEIQDHKYH